jgi:hypothetical protein
VSHWRHTSSASKTWTSSIDIARRARCLETLLIRRRVRPDARTDAGISWRGAWDLCVRTNSQKETQWSIPVHCPRSDRTIYTAPNGSKFGVLCDTYTSDTSSQWGSFFGLGFRECLCNCDYPPGCTVATYSGTCYLKKIASGQGFTDGATALDWTAVRLGRNYMG